MSTLRKHKTVREALQYVAAHPDPGDRDPIDVPVWELMCRSLFDVANTPNAKVRGSMGRATKAQKMIADRLVGLRRPGTHPAVLREQAIEFRDLTAGLLDEEGGDD